MKSIHILVVTLFSVSLFSCDQGVQNNGDFAPELESKLDTLSYLFGYNNAKQWENQGLEDMDMQVFLGAMNEAYAGEEAKVDALEKGNMLSQYLRELREEKAANNLKESEEFLAKNANKDNIITTESGLQYEVIEEGDGRSVEPLDRVKVDYHGTLMNGNVFDSSVKKDEPATFNVTNVVPGFKEGLLLMQEGAKYRLYIPPSLGYGERGSPNIGPNQALIFDLTLHQVIKPEDITKSLEED